MYKLVAILAWLFISCQLHAQEKNPDFQDPQNMKVEPEHTDCHKLPGSFTNLQEALNTIENTRFYDDQKLRTTRRSGLMQARYVSCDFKTGFLIVRYDGMDQVFTNVEKQVWEDLQKTADIDGYYHKHIKVLEKIEDQ